MYKNLYADPREEKHKLPYSKDKNHFEQTLMQAALNGDIASVLPDL